MILRPVSPVSPFGPADDEAPGRVYEVLHFLRDHVLRQDRLQDLLDHGFGKRLVPDLRGMLGREHDGVDLGRAATVVAHRHLRLGVGPEPRQPAGMAQFRLLLHQAVREVDRQRHQLWRLVAGVAEHESLVARALLEVESAALVDALRDVRRLLVVGDEHAAAAVVDPVLRVVVADVLDHAAGDALPVDHGLRGDLAGEHDEPGAAEGLGRDARRAVLGQHRVQHGVGDLVRDLVGMAFADRLGREEISCRSWIG